MTREPRAFFALDHGAATTTLALVGHLGGRWRLVSSAAAPAGVEVDLLLARLVDRVRLEDSSTLADLDGGEPASTAALVERWPRLEARSSPPRRLAVLAGSRRQRRHLETAAERAGWRVDGCSSDEHDPLELTALALSMDVDTLLLGADEPPSGDERRHLPQLATLAAAAAQRRPELQVVLAGGAAAYAGTFGPSGASASDERSAAAPASEPEGPAPQTAGAGAPPASAVVLAASGDAAAADAARTGRDVLLAPAASAGVAGRPLQQVLESCRVAADDSRVSIARSIASLAFVLDRTIEAVEVGLDGGLRCRAEPVGEGHRMVELSETIVAAAGIAPPDPDDAVIDSVLAWSTVPLDRYRLADRLRELRIRPWSEADGEGALLRIAVARAALERLVGATPELTAMAAPDLIVASGGAWGPIPPPVVALALADILRRSGASQLALDEARLLAPLGTIEDETERRTLLADLADDVLVPLGSLVLPTGLRPGRNAGRLRVHGGESVSELDLLPGGVEVVDLPPGQAATAELHFHDTVRLGARGRHFTTQVTGGLGGLLVDLRDIPLRLPERSDNRRAVLDSWQRALWAEVES